MTSFQSYGDQFGWLHEFVAKELGVSVGTSSKEVRAISKATMVLFGTLARTLVNNAVLTDAQLQTVWNEALAATYEDMPVEPVNTTSTRYNPSANPALANDATGWTTDGGSGTLTAVSGFLRPNVYRCTGTAFILTPLTTVSPGEVHTQSVWFQRGLVGTSDIDASVNFYLADGTTFLSASVAQTFTIASSTPSRLYTTVTVPESAAGMRMVVGVPDAAGTYDVTMHLPEHTAELRDYFDGATPGASWDGTAGSSASTWPPA